MNKKIKDLTLEECRKICEKYETLPQCINECPLREVCGYDECHIARLKIIRKEVEIDESNND